MSEGTTKKRVFVYEGRQFEDPGDEYTDEQVRDMLARTFGPLNGGNIDREEKDDAVYVTLTPRPQHKGAGAPVDDVLAALGYEVEQIPQQDAGALIIQINGATRQLLSDFAKSGSGPAVQQKALQVALLATGLLAQHGLPQAQPA